MRSHAARSVLFLSFVSVGLTGLSSPASASGFEAHRLWSARGDQQEGAKFGSAVASAGDVNGDGRPDLIVGAPGHDGAAGAATGKVFVFYNSAAGLPSAPSWSAEGEHTGDRFGEAVASAGDVNGDGFGDVIVGSPGVLVYDTVYTTLVLNRGRIYVYYGSVQGLSPTPAFTADGRTYDLGFMDGLGYAVASGDFNGDGYADIVAAQYMKYVGGTRVYYGSAQGPSPTPSWSGDGFWQTHALAVGDANGDGYDDLIIASDVQDDDAEPSRWAILTFGSPTGLGPEGPPPELGVRGSKLAFGDLDQDGFDDLVTIHVGPPGGRASTPTMRFIAALRQAQSRPRTSGESSTFTAASSSSAT
jgi:FG-GAP repeat/FG-GAP-like repeat